MSLHVLERTLLTLYTQPHELKAFVESPAQYLEQRDLTPRERMALADISLERLSAFQRQLHHKSMKIARSLLRNRSAVVLMSLHPKSPALLWGDPIAPSTERLSPGNYQFLHQLSRLKQPLSLRALIRWYSESPSASAADMFALTRLMYTHRLTGSQIRIPLVL